MGLADMSNSGLKKKFQPSFSSFFIILSITVTYHPFHTLESVVSWLRYGALKIALWLSSDFN